MLGKAIGAQAIGHGGRRESPSEQDGPRPGGVRREESERAVEARAARATRP